MAQAVLIGAVIVLALLTWTLLRHLASDRMQQFTDRRRGSSRFVSLGEFVDGSRHLPVAMALSGSAFYYENSNMQASLDLQWIQEVEYENELATGHHVGTGRVMRLRCFSQTFEFVLPEDVVAQWQAILPAREYPRADIRPVGDLARGAA
jgi:hypothetical protein